jgi:hypothetical protein
MAGGFFEGAAEEGEGVESAAGGDGGQGLGRVEEKSFCVVDADVTHELKDALAGLAAELPGEVLVAWDAGGWNRYRCGARGGLVVAP